MNKTLLHKIIITLFFIAPFGVIRWVGWGLMAQMPHDAVYMAKGSACPVIMYGNSSWNQYWENTLKRDNLNIGTHTTESITAMVALGITKKLNVIVGLPYIFTRTSAGNLMGQKGIQDLMVWAKYKAVNVNGFTLSPAFGVSVPLGNYVPDFLPMSIGLQCRTVSGRLIANYKHPKTGLYVTAHGTYTWRSNITVDRSAYQANDKVYNTNVVGVPNAVDAGVRFGILKKKIQAEVFAERFACVSGDNIRRNDMPFPTNNMEATTVGAYTKIQPKNLGITLRAGQVINGLNVGQSTSFMVGVLYQIGPFKK